VTRAIVLAGGEGTRLRPYTAVIPKPLMPIGDRPILEIVLLQLKRAGFTNVVLSLGYRADLIVAFFGDGSNFGLEIEYVREDTPLGTVGALALVGGLDEPFLVMNGDVLTDLDYAELLRRHADSDALITIATVRKHVEITLGIPRMSGDGSGRLVDFLEKPGIDVDASMGVYGVSPDVLKYIQPHEKLDFPDLVHRLLTAGESVRAWSPGGDWLDIGRHEDYDQAMAEFERMRDRLVPEPAVARR
jgi:NDP-sugar pyrophosphorylase family protein